MTMPDFLNAIIVVSWGKPELTEEALWAIHHGSNRRQWIIWVQNEYKPHESYNTFTARRLLNEGANLSIIQNRTNLGFAKAVNQGITMAMHDPKVTHITLINNDVIVGRHWDIRMATALSLSGYGAVGPMSDDNTMHNVNACKDRWTYVRKWHDGEYILAYDNRLHSLSDWTDRVTAHSTPVLAFFCTMFPRSTIETVGLLEEGFGLAYCEDSDYCIRMRQADLKMGITSAVAVHHVGGATTADKPNLELRGAAFRKFRQKWGTEVVDNLPTF